MHSNISNFLEKFKSALADGDDLRIAVCTAVEETTKFPLDKKYVSFRGECVVIKADTYLKTEIFLNKEEILLSIQKSCPQKMIRDII